MPRVRARKSDEIEQLKAYKAAAGFMETVMFGTMLRAFMPKLELQIVERPKKEKHGKD